MRARERGQMSLFVAVLAPGLLALAALGIDSGRAVTGEVRAMDVAAGAARSGSQALFVPGYEGTAPERLDAAAAQRAAQAFLTAAGASGDVAVSGTDVRVTVRVTVPTMTTWFIGRSSWTMSADATSRAERGVEAPTS